MEELQSKVYRLMERQKREWPLAIRNYRSLRHVQVRKLLLEGGAEITLQFNPGRIVSSAAKVDKQSIQDRPCFLCETHRPQEQESVVYGDYELLLNPFPIFEQHLTIPLKAHEEQWIRPHVEVMLDLSRELHDFTLFYNGPRCGASAPDHFHFQAGSKGLMPVEKDFREGGFARLLCCIDGLGIYIWKNYHRGVLSLESASKAALKRAFVLFYRELELMQPLEKEPMLNLLTYWEDGKWVIHCFPRIRHRPDCYFRQDEEQVLSSPASVDLGGVFIMPREEDFNKIDVKHLETILAEVCMDDKSADILANRLMTAING